jgi:signal peptidase II
MKKAASIRCFGLGLLAAGFALLLDQGSKWLLFDSVHIMAEPPMAITPFFNLVMVWNYGISFGMFSGHRRPFIVITLSVIIMGILLLWLWRNRSKAAAFGLGSVIGGAAGNVIDRLRFGAVADFFDFHLGIYHWPAFNIADSCIFIGVVVLCLQGMLVTNKGQTA